MVHVTDIDVHELRQIDSSVVSWWVEGEIFRCTRTELLTDQLVDVAREGRLRVAQHELLGSCMVSETVHEGVAPTTTPGGAVLPCENKVCKVSHHFTHTVVKVIQVEEMRLVKTTTCRTGYFADCHIALMPYVLKYRFDEFQ